MKREDWVKVDLLGRGTTGKKGEKGRKNKKERAGEKGWQVPPAERGKSRGQREGMTGKGYCTRNKGGIVNRQKRRTKEGGIFREEGSNMTNRQT